jgi:glycosyltransferase involved in cell wall biosynthesis
LTSTDPAIQEVAGDAAVFRDPEDTEAIADALATLLDDASLRAGLSCRGLERARRFSWERTATETLDVYRRYAAGRR